MDNDITLTLHFSPGHKIAIKSYSTLDLSRRDNVVNINITNTEPDFAFNYLYEQIQKFLGKSETFTIEVKRKAGKATFHHMTAHYHLSTHNEILTFSQQQLNETNSEQ